MDVVTPGSEPILRIEKISKRFGAVQALEEVSFAIRPAEVVALLGDNGAGKSTLIKIISGELQPDSGTLFFAGRPVRIQTPSQSKVLGIETVYQDLSLCPNVDVVANFFMGREITWPWPFGLLDERRMKIETEKALRDIGIEIPSVRTPVALLSGGQRQAIELCRFIHWGGRLAMLDEPFAALGVEQTRRGLDLIRRVKDQGIAVMVITHNILHAFQVADRAVILRHGQVAGIRSIVQTSPDEVVSVITGDATSWSRTGEGKEQSCV